MSFDAKRMSGFGTKGHKRKKQNEKRIRNGKKNEGKGVYLPRTDEQL